MIFTETPLAGAWVIELDLKSDERGFFARSFCQHEFAEHGLQNVVAQGNLSYNHRRGTLRGMHYQLPPVAETKMVRCTRGTIYDVIVDLRPDSPTRFDHFGVELSAENHTALYVPELFAHAYLTLTDGAEVTYQVTEFYTAGAERGLHYADPAFGIQWPTDVTVISDKDASWPRFDAATVLDGP